ncbi:DUF5712 family protein [Bacteroides fragilis]|jgi:ribosomal protein S15P/S13E|uniref:DUF5712 family protein n=1 Tax=Bacteroides fragilis TaxID=817 RepID=UPI000E1D50A8|nr:DUF5712 family protein [Bacteroides fragilis]RDT78592.1 clindamycin resistance transfer factor BtgB [Bacteroides fragilis]
MHIDFAPPSNGTYNNAGSSRQLANYLEHEDFERMEKGIYTEGFFNLTNDNIYKSKLIKDIDSNIGQLLKTDAKFYAIHVSPSEKELQVMGNTEQERAEAMKRYIREVFIPEYANNFNKGLSASDIKFYGKIHFDRNRSDNELNMHCHLIVSRKDQANKKKLSPLTNHKNTKKGTIKGGFDRKNLFLQVEQGFDKVFDYNRQQTESFNYHNTMKNGSILEQLELQEQKIVGRKTIDVQTNENVKTTSNISIQQQISISVNQSTNNSVNQSSDRDALSFLFPILPSVTDFNPRDKQQQLRHKKKKNQN